VLRIGAGVGQLRSGLRVGTGVWKVLGLLGLELVEGLWLKLDWGQNRVGLRSWNLVEGFGLELDKQ